MKIKILYFLILVISISSCNKKGSTFVNDDSDISDTIRIDDQKDIRSIGETLLPESKKKVKDWNEYEQLDQLLTKFYSISPTEALNLSKELSTITQQLKDSVTIERFTYPDISIRINVLHNHALRLSDMSTISAINSGEVKSEIQGILDAFSALNAKINNITKQEKIEAELKDIQVN